MNEELELVVTEEIQKKIYTIRGKQVMLDSDVANLYHVKTRIISQALKRNTKRFPESFCFQLTEIEMENMQSQNVIAAKRNSRYLPYAFTDKGIAMLALLLNNKIAVQVSINIMNTIVSSEHCISNEPKIFSWL